PSPAAGCTRPSCGCGTRARVSPDADVGGRAARGPRGPSSSVVGRAGRPVRRREHAAMVDRRARRPAASRGWASIGVGVVLALAMVLFFANARLTGGVDARQPQDLAGLYEAEAARVAELEEEIVQLRAEVDALTGENDRIPAADPELLELAALA